MSPVKVSGTGLGETDQVAAGQLPWKTEVDRHLSRAMPLPGVKLGFQELWLFLTGQESLAKAAEFPQDRGYRDSLNAEQSGPVARIQKDVFDSGLNLEWASG